MGFSLATSETDLHGERLERVRGRWDPWDPYVCVSSGRDGEHVKKIERGRTGNRSPVPGQTLGSLVESGDLERLPRATANTKDVVYLIQRESGGAVKIGHTTTTGLNKRLRALQSANDEELVVRELLDGGSWLESALHLLFKDQRIRGEWFQVSHLMLDLFPLVVG